MAGEAGRARGEIAGQQAPVGGTVGAQIGAGVFLAALLLVSGLRAEPLPEDYFAGMPALTIARLSVSIKTETPYVSQEGFEHALAHTKAAEDSQERMAAVLAGEASLYQAARLRGQERLDFLEKAARGGDAAAAAALGDMLDTGDGVRADPLRALGYYRAGALGGRMDAAHNLGAAYAKGRGVPRDFGEALAWLIVAQKRGDKSGVDEQLRQHLRDHHHEETLAVAEQHAAELGAKAAAEAIVAALPVSEVMTYDEELAVAPTEDGGTGAGAAAKIADTPAAPPVVVMTILGDRMEWPSQAELERAANRGDPAALAAMGRMIVNGKLPADPLRAMVLLERAAAAGNIDAAHQLGDLYSKGETIVRDDAKAFGYFLQAARGGSTLAMASVGVFYTNGRGVERDPVQGLAWLIAAKHYSIDFGQEARLRGFLARQQPDGVAKAEALSAKLLGEIKIKAR